MPGVNYSHGRGWFRTSDLSRVKSAAGFATYCEALRRASIETISAESVSVSCALLRSVA